MTAFFDSSALVKLYVPEHRADDVRRIDGPRLCSLLARIEVPAAFWRLTRTGHVDPDDARTLADAFAADAAGSPSDGRPLVPLLIDTTIVDLAAALVARHPLKGCDAAHLATAMTARHVQPDVDTFVTFDRALDRAAVAEGFKTLRP